MYWEKEGAFTGEISAAMLKAIGCEHVIIGHSERRQYFGETDDTVNRRLEWRWKRADAHCLRGRSAGRARSRADRRRAAAPVLAGLQWHLRPQGGKLSIAYEPVWAIGTGKTATPAMAADAHAVIRQEAAKSFGEEFAAALRILYGGSVKPDNAKALMAEEEIDGALVGGASLDPKNFSKIVEY